MAIAFVRREWIKAGSGSAVAFSNYMARSAGVDRVSGVGYSFTHRSSDLLSSGLMLPDDAPRWACEIDELWNAATEAELVKDRKSGELRFRRNAGGEAQIAQTLTVALPKELTLEQNRDLLSRWISERYHSSRVAVQWAIHSDEKKSGNIHAHLIISTRRLGPDGFGEKARENDPKIARGRIMDKGDLTRDWQDFQNSYFREREIDLTVDPIRSVPGVHEGASRFVDASETAAHQRAMEERQREIARNDQNTIEHLLLRKSTFSEREIETYLRKSGLSDSEVIERRDAVLRREDVVRIEERRRGTNGVVVFERFTSRHVLNEEGRALSVAQQLSKRSEAGIDERQRRELADRKNLDSEQRLAFEHATADNHFAIITGRAGTGKSFTIGAVRDAYGEAGYRVIGLAPTNVVAADLQKDGFEEARTARSELMRQEGGHAPWDRRTVVIVDEAGMLANRDTAALLDHAALTGAKVIFVGDDRQLASVERGGLFTDLQEANGTAELTTVRRQSEQWQRDASQQAAIGDFRGALAAYDERKKVKWMDEREEARRALVDDWKSFAAGGDLPSVYASTNAAVDALNQDLRQARHDLGQIDRATERSFVVERGEEKRETTVSEGDRIIFNATVKDRAAGLELRNGEAGEIKRIDGNKLSVLLDSGRTVEFDGSERRGWMLGYASTVYKAQGKTKGRVLALYDNPHVWRSDTAYVALTRHRNELQLYASREAASDLRALGRQMGRDGTRRSALAYDLVPTPDRDPSALPARPSPAPAEAPKTVEQMKAAYEAARGAPAEASKTVEQMRADYEAARDAPAEAPKTVEQMKAEYEAARDATHAKEYDRATRKRDYDRDR